MFNVVRAEAAVGAEGAEAAEGGSGRKSRLSFVPFEQHRRVDVFTFSNFLTLCYKRDKLLKGFEILTFDIFSQFTKRSFDN